MADKATLYLCALSQVSLEARRARRYWVASTIRNTNEQLAQMQYEYPLLEALAAIVREGSFEAAARALNISQSAVSQRVKLLEERTGVVLVVRGRPCVPTEYGQKLCRHLDQVHLLEHDLRKSLSKIDHASSERPAVIRVAVNSDSLATWFPELIKQAGSKLNLTFDIIPDDQEHTAERLQSGEALAAVTTQSVPLPGCRRVPLGSIEYVGAATPSFAAAHFPNGPCLETLTRSPHIVFDRKDMLVHQWIINAFGSPARLRGHLVPSFSGYLACCLNGSGWGVVPRSSVERHFQEGSLIQLVPDASVIVPLYWQTTTPDSEIMKALSSTVAQVARRHLVSSANLAESGAR